MADHYRPDFRINSVSQERYEEENGEEQYIESEYDDGYPIEP